MDWGANSTVYHNTRPIEVFSWAQEGLDLWSPLIPVTCRVSSLGYWWWSNSTIRVGAIDNLQIRPWLRTVLSSSSVSQQKIARWFPLMISLGSDILAPPTAGIRLDSSKASLLSGLIWIGPSIPGPRKRTVCSSEIGMNSKSDPRIDIVQVLVGLGMWLLLEISNQTAGSLDQVD